MYTKITDPITNIKYNINSRQGKNILRKYLNFLNGGASRTIVTAAISESGGNRNKSDLVLSIYPESFSKRHLNKYFNFEQHIRALSLPKIEEDEQVRIQTAIKREHFSVDEKIQLIELYIELMAHGDPERFAKYTTFLDSSKPNIVNQIKESLMVDLLSSIKSNESVAGSDIIRMSDIDILAGAESNIQATGHYYMKQLETVLNTDSSEEIIKQKLEEMNSRYIDMICDTMVNTYENMRVFAKVVADIWVPENIIVHDSILERGVDRYDQSDNSSRSESEELMNQYRNIIDKMTSLGLLDLSEEIPKDAPRTKAEMRAEARAARLKRFTGGSRTQTGGSNQRQIPVGAVSAAAVGGLIVVLFTPAAVATSAMGAYALVVTGAAYWHSRQQAALPAQAQAPPMRAQAPPMRAQAPPMRAQAPPMRAQAPPVRAQASVPPTVTWEWEDGAPASGDWTPFYRLPYSELENMFTYEESGIIRIDGVDYDMDLELMIQTNVQSGKERRIRRMLQGVQTYFPPLVTPSGGGARGAATKMATLPVYTWERDRMMPWQVATDWTPFTVTESAELEKMFLEYIVTGVSNSVTIDGADNDIDLTDLTNMIIKNTDTGERFSIRRIQSGSPTHPPLMTPSGGGASAATQAPPPSAVIWEWEDALGNWTPAQELWARDLEELLQSGKKYATQILGGMDHDIDTELMILTNVVTQAKIRIRRKVNGVQTNPLLATPSGGRAPSATQAPPPPAIIWEWESGRGNWTRYMDDDMFELEDMFTYGQNGTIRIDGVDYDMDLELMTQTNWRTGTTRNIRRFANGVQTHPPPATPYGGGAAAAKHAQTHLPPATAVATHAGSGGGGAWTAQMTAPETVFNKIINTWAADHSVAINADELHDFFVNRYSPIGDPSDPDQQINAGILNTLIEYFIPRQGVIARRHHGSVASEMRLTDAGVHADYHVPSSLAAATALVYGLMKIPTPNGGGGGVGGGGGGGAGTIVCCKSRRRRAGGVPQGSDGWVSGDIDPAIDYFNCLWKIHIDSADQVVGPWTWNIQRDFHYPPRTLFEFARIRAPIASRSGPPYTEETQSHPYYRPKPGNQNPLPSFTQTDAGSVVLFHGTSYASLSYMMDLPGTITPPTFSRILGDYRTHTMPGMVDSGGGGRTMLGKGLYVSNLPEDSLSYGVAGASTRRRRGMGVVVIELVIDDAHMFSAGADFIPNTVGYQLEQAVIANCGRQFQQKVNRVKSKIHIYPSGTMVNMRPQRAGYNSTSPSGGRYFLSPIDSWNRPNPIP